MAVKRERAHDELDVSDMKPSKCATIHGMVVGSLSPVQTSKRSSVKYFEGNLSDGKKVTRLISFEPKLREGLESMREKGNCLIVACNRAN